MRPSAARRAVVALFLLAALAVLLQGGSVPHVHLGHEPAFFNAEHDLTLLAALATQGIPAEPAPSLGSLTGFTPLDEADAQEPPARLAPSGQSRAPPLA